MQNTLIVLTEKQVEDLLRKVVGELVTPQQPEPVSQLLTTPEAADRMNCCPKTIINLIEVGKLKAINIHKGSGKRCRYKILKSDLEAFIKSRRY